MPAQRSGRRPQFRLTARGGKATDALPLQVVRGFHTMRIKTLAALLAASSLITASPASAANPASALSPSAAGRASAQVAEQSKIMDSGFIGFALVFGLGLVAGYLLHSVLSGDEEPESP
jgi:hypothetical protein